MTKTLFILALLFWGCNQSIQKEVSSEINNKTTSKSQDSTQYSIKSYAQLNTITYPKGNVALNDQDKAILNFCEKILYTLNPKLIDSNYNVTISSTQVELTNKNKHEFFVYEFSNSNKNETINPILNTSEYKVKSISHSKAPIMGWFFNKKNDLCVAITNGNPFEFRNKIDNNQLIELIKNNTSHSLKQQ